MSLAFLKRTIEQVEDERRRTSGVSRAKSRLPFLDWVREHIKIRTVQFSLLGHEHLTEIYTNLHPYEVYRKAAQVGISTKCLCEGLWLCDRFGSKILYYMATDQDGYDFSNDRVAPVIDESPRLTDLMDTRTRGRDNVGLRHVGHGSFYVRGMFTKTKVKSVDADFLALDELDEADQGNKRFALDRIMASWLQVVRELSQPSIPDYGIDESFSRTDQRFYHHKCPACGKYTSLDEGHVEDAGRLIPRHIIEVPRAMRSQFAPGQKWYRACGHCQAKLDMASAQWVAAHPSRIGRRGYHLSQLYRQQPMVGHADPADWIMATILEARKTSEKLRATISILGYPYAGARAPVTEKSLDAAEGPDGFVSDLRGCYMGIDQGDQLHIVVGRSYGHPEKIQIVYIETTEQWERIPRLAEQFGVVSTIIDALPNKKSAKDLAKAAAHSFRIQYFQGETLKESTEGEGDKEVQVVSVDRTETLDNTVGLMLSGGLLLPALSRLGGEDLAEVEALRAHLKMLAKDIKTDAKGVDRWVYKRKVENHYGMALNSMVIARQMAPIVVRAGAFGAGLDLTPD